MIDTAIKTVVEVLFVVLDGKPLADHWLIVPWIFGGAVLCSVVLLWVLQQTAGHWFSLIAVPVLVGATMMLVVGPPIWQVHQLRECRPVTVTIQGSTHPQNLSTRECRTLARWNTDEWSEWRVQINQ